MSTFTGMLQFDEATKQIYITSANHPYKAVIDELNAVEIRLTNDKEWIPAYLIFSDFYKEWLGKEVEIRLKESQLIVRDFFMALKKDTMICEVYKEPDPEQRMRTADYVWDINKVIFRGPSYLVLLEYSENVIYHWEAVDSVLRICVGNVDSPREITLENLKLYKKTKNSYARPCWSTEQGVVKRILPEQFAKDKMKYVVEEASRILAKGDTKIISQLDEQGFDYIRNNELHNVFYSHMRFEDAYIELQGIKK